MEGFLVVSGLFLLPAGAIIGFAILVARSCGRPTFFRFEYVSWLLPGLVYWSMLGPVNPEQAFRGKSLANLVEPAFVGVICGACFVLRTVVAANAPTTGRAAAWTNVALSTVAAIAEFASRNVELSEPLKDTDDGLRGFELEDADGYVLFFGRPLQ